MPPEHAARVFERFFRADPSRARASGGSGLGLSIVSAIAEAHGGRVEVETQPGRGATFRVVLPRSGPAGPGPEAPAAHPAASAPGPPRAVVEGRAAPAEPAARPGRPAPGRGRNRGADGLHQLHRGVGDA